MTIDQSNQKRRASGMLISDDQWSINSSMHSRHSEKGEDGYSCAHCGKGIKNLVVMSHPNHGTVIVGEDCAEALAEGSAKTRLNDHFEIKKNELKNQKKVEKTNARLKAQAQKEINTVIAAAIMKWKSLSKEEISKQAEEVMKKYQFLDQVGGFSICTISREFAYQLEIRLRKI